MKSRLFLRPGRSDGTKIAETFPRRRVFPPPVASVSPTGALPAGNTTAPALGALKPMVHWLAPGGERNEPSSVAAGQPAVAEDGVEIAVRPNTGGGPAFFSGRPALAGPPPHPDSAWTT